MVKPIRPMRCLKSPPISAVLTTKTTTHCGQKTPAAYLIFGGGENSIPPVLHQIPTSVREKARKNTGTFLAPERYVFANNSSVA